MTDPDKTELYRADLTGAAWRTSSFSKAGKACVEIAELDGGAVAVRDSRNRRAPALRFTAEEWDAFRKGVLHGEFGR